MACVQIMGESETGSFWQKRMIMLMDTEGFGNNNSQDRVMTASNVSRGVIDQEWSCCLQAAWS